jgi:hypothetical protein
VIIFSTTSTNACVPTASRFGPLRLPFQIVILDGFFQGLVEMSPEFIDGPGLEQ